MRKILLASVMFTALAGIAHAQIAVIDGASIAREAAEAAKELASLQAQYQELVSTYRSLAHLTNINGMATGLSAAAIQNPFSGLVPQGGIMQGQTFNGLGPAQSQAQSIYGQQQVPTNMTAQQSASFMSQWISQRSMSLSSMQALAIQLLSTAQSRSAMLPQLQAQLQGAQDVTAVNAINGRILLEQNYLQSAQAQAAQLSALEQSQDRMARNQILQKQQMDAQRAMTDNAVDLGGL